MKKLVWLGLSLILTFANLACTNSELKKKAIQQADEDYREVLRKEIESLEMPGRLRDNYLSYLQNTVSYEVVDIKKPTETMAIVSVSQSAVPIENRKTLAQIAVGIDPAKTTSFNMGNAINLIEQQPGQVRGKKESLYFIKLSKTPSGWKTEK